MLADDEVLLGDLAGEEERVLQVAERRVLTDIDPIYIRALTDIRRWCSKCLLESSPLY